MKKLIKRLTSKEIEFLKDRYESLRFNNEFDLIYESQIPNTGVVLIEGSMTLLKRKKVKETVPAGSMIGVQELVNNEPLPMGCKVMENSELIILQKSEILEALDDKENELYAIIRK